MDELYTIREVAEKLKISVSSVYRYVESGRFPHIKLGTNIRFSRDHISAFLAENSIKNEKDTAYPSSAELTEMYDRLQTGGIQ